VVNNANVSEVRIQFLIFSSPIGLDNKFFFIKQALNKRLELFEFLEDLRFVLEQVDPNEFAIIIKETHIILISSNRLTCRSHTSEKISSREAVDTLDEVG
jgi:hypothetical protein